MNDEYDITLSEHDEQVLEVLDQYLKDRESGFLPNLDIVISKYPHLESRIRDCVQGLEAVEQFASRAQAPSHVTPKFPQIKDFRIVEELGRGGMGIVYRAEQVSLARPVALKVLPLAAVFQPKNVERFKNEALATAQLDHPNIINVYSVGRENGVHFFSMQLVEGQSLSQLIAQMHQKDLPTPPPSAERSHEVQSRLSNSSLALTPTISTAHDSSISRSLLPSSSSSKSSHHLKREFFQGVAQIGLQTATALQHAHENGIVHRDIKPSNLLLDHRGNILISDFGLARIQGEAELTATGDLLGTLKYMSPEQTSGRPEQVDHRTDIYSLGATLYELLTCQKPSLRVGQKLGLVAAQEDRIIPPRRVDPAIPVDLETIIIKSMAHERDHRYLTASELANDLQRFLDDQPIRARRPTFRQRSAKWLKRNRWVATTAAIFACLLVAGSAISSLLIYYQYNKARTAELELKQKNERLQSALARANAAETKVDKLPSAFEKLGIEFFDSKSYNQALKMFDAALVLAPKANNIRFFRARTLAEMGQFKMARQEFTNLIKLSADHSADSHYWRAKLEIEKGNAQDGVADLERAEALGCQYPDLYRLLCGISLHNRDFAKVETYAQKGASENRGDVMMPTMLFVAQWQLKKYSAANATLSSLNSDWNQPWDGRILCMESLCLSREGGATNLKTAKGKLYQALRWFEFRLGSGPQQDRETAQWLIRQSCEACNSHFRFEDPNHWKHLKRWRLESSVLVDLSSVEASQNNPIYQGPMNSKHWGTHWTPIRPGKNDNGVQLFWNVKGRNAIGSQVTIHLNDQARCRRSDMRNFPAGKYRLSVYLTKSNDFGIVQFWLNGQPIGTPIDLFDQAPRGDPRDHAAQHGETNLGFVELVDGINELVIEVVGKNPKSDGFHVGLDFLDLWPVDFAPGQH